MTPGWYWRKRREAEAWCNAILDRYVMETMLHCCIELPADYAVRTLVGYNPQLLLEDHSR